MLLSRKVEWWILSAVTAAVAGVLTRKLVNVLWLAVSGRQVPLEDDDRSISVPEAAAWAAGVGAAAGVARVVSRRSAAAVWEKATGEPPPGATSKP